MQSHSHTQTLVTLTYIYNDIRYVKRTQADRASRHSAVKVATDYRTLPPTSWTQSRNSYSEHSCRTRPCARVALGSEAWWCYDDAYRVDSREGPVSGESVAISRPIFSQPVGCESPVPGREGNTRCRAASTFQQIRRLQNHACAVLKQRQVGGSTYPRRFVF